MQRFKTGVLGLSPAARVGIELLRGVVAVNVKFGLFSGMTATIG
jgi:hypothetical protein